jgi:hypothetical protein
VLQRRFRVLRFDLRGHGASEAPEGEYTIAMLAQDALAVADAAGARRFRLRRHLARRNDRECGSARMPGDRLERLVVSNTSAEDVGDGMVRADRQGPRRRHRRDRRRVFAALVHGRATSPAPTKRLRARARRSSRSILSGTSAAARRSATWT